MESGGGGGAGDAGGADIEWLAFELRPAPRPLLEPRGGHLRVDWTQNVYRRALELGIEIHLPRYQPRSTLALAACVWAEGQGGLRDFKHALYEAFFCEGEDIATDAELARAAGRAGLDPAAAVAAAYPPELFARIREIRIEAEAAGGRGRPSLLNDDGGTPWGTGGNQRALSRLPVA